MTAVKTPSIDQLQELPLAVPPFAYWPQTWGWLVLLVLLLLTLGIWGLLRWRRWRRNLYRRQALVRLAWLEHALSQQEQRLPALRELPELLKRVALSMPDAPPVASLGGARWQAFLLQRCRAVPQDFATRLFTVAYAPDAQLLALADGEVRALFEASRQWIEGHHVAV